MAVVTDCSNQSSKHVGSGPVLSLLRRRDLLLQGVCALPPILNHPGDTNELPIGSGKTLQSPQCRRDVS